MTDADTVEHRLRNFAQGCRGSMWQSRDETISLMDAAADEITRLKAAIAALPQDRVPAPTGGNHDAALDWITSNCMAIRRDNGDMDYSLGQMIKAFEAGAALPPAVPDLARHQPCGCVVCQCESDEQCSGCGAKNCGTHAAGEIPNPVYVATPDPVAEAAKVILGNRYGGYGNRRAMHAMWDFVYEQHGRHMLPVSHYDGVFQAGLRALTKDGEAG